MPTLEIVLLCIYCIIAGLNFATRSMFPSKNKNGKSEGTLSIIVKSIFWIIAIFFDKKGDNLINF